ncbi:Uncharacterised protein [Neisseria animaloris]|uniref:Uncharacterized protein n=1 Tax=Neisseria animaloris TaxID=326522 RepID=A0A3S5A4Z8_9NEIS|nr:Uncharacterised protein [Neisseria animaloris]
MECIVGQQHITHFTRLIVGMGNTIAQASIGILISSVKYWIFKDLSVKSSPACLLLFRLVGTLLLLILNSRGLLN